MMFGLEGDTASAPMDGADSLSKIGFQVKPPSVVFQTPPPSAPM
jgi:hypothetical protein